MSGAIEAPGESEPLVPFDGFPFIVGWELTLACNLRCQHCGSFAGAARKDELTTAEALRICDELPELLVQEVDFTGGEPLLRRDWSVIVGRVVELGIQVNLLTNGLAVEKEVAAELERVGVSGVGVSLDGLQPTHDRVRGAGSFASVLRAIRVLQDAGVSLNVLTTVHPLNLAELPAIGELLESLGVSAWRLQTLMPMGRVLSQGLRVLDREQLLALGQFIRERSAHPSGGLRLLCSDGLEYVHDAANEGRRWRGCSAGLVAVGITADGRVKGCLSMPDALTEGDLRRASLWDVWFRPGAFPYTRGFKREQLGPNCSGCDKALECLGGCTASSFTSTGLFHNDPICFRAAERCAGVLDRRLRPR